MKGIRITIATAASLVGLALIFAPAPAAADNVINDDCIIIGSQCIGFDCVNGENFGFDTLRLKENNLRVHFQDTSSSASFPSGDWRIVINDSFNGGASYFAVEDSDNGRQSFRIERGARSNALYVEDDGDIGIGTSTPVADVHIKTGNTPTLRLEQDGSSGFASQIWDLAGNEANFFIRDATSGSTLPFRIFPGAPSNAISIAAGAGDVGIGTTSPGEEVHVRRTGTGATRVLVENTNSTAQQTGMRFVNSTTEWQFLNLPGGEFVIREPGSDEFELDQAGNLTISGSISTSDCMPCVSDYVFEPGYELMPLAELEAFVWREKHLPNVPSQGDVDRAGKLDMTQMQMRMLEKIEELVLYTLQQEKTINELGARLAALEAPSAE